MTDQKHPPPSGEAPDQASASTRIPKKVVLTDKSIAAFRPASAGRRYIVWDAQQPHLGVRVTERGTKSFIVVRRRPGHTNPDTCVIGKYPTVSLRKARKSGSGILATISDGKLPREIEAQRRREDARRNKETFGNAVSEFLDGALSGLRSGAETEAYLRRDFLGQSAKRWRKRTERKGRATSVWVNEWIDGPDPIWATLQVAQIARRDVIIRLDAIKRRRGKHAARHALGAIRKFFSWCVEGERYGIGDISPCTNIRDKTLGFSKDGRELRRKRVLTDAELRDVWRGVEQLSEKTRNRALNAHPDADVSRVFDPVEPLVKLLMLSGQRLNDIARVKWSEIDFEKATLTVPPERYKTGTAQEVPLLPIAVNILKAMPRFGRGFVFTSTGGANPISGTTRLKARLDSAIAEQRMKCGHDPMQDWVFHDLRRTIRTRLVSDIGIDASIAERVIGHTLPGLHKVYDQGSHRSQKRDEFVSGLALLLSIVEPPPAGKNKAPPVRKGAM